MDLTDIVYQLAAALIGVVVPIATVLAAAAAKKALDAIQVEKYAGALREYDATLYAALLEAGQAAMAKALDQADAFTESDVKPFLYSQAAEISRAFSEKAGVRVDLNEQRVDALVELAISEAKKAAGGPPPS